MEPHGQARGSSIYPANRFRIAPSVTSAEAVFRISAILHNALADGVRQCFVEDATIRGGAAKIFGEHPS